MKALYDWFVELGKQEAVRRLRDPLGTCAQTTEPAAVHRHQWLYTVDAETVCSDCGDFPDDRLWRVFNYSFARTCDPPRGMVTSEGRKRRVFEMGETKP